MKNFWAILCVLVSSSPLFGMEDLPKVINKGTHILLLEGRDTRILGTFLSKVRNANHISSIAAYNALSEVIRHEQKIDEKNFNQVSTPSPVIMLGGQGHNGKQTLVLKKRYNFGGWSAAAAFVAGIGIGYLWFGGLAEIQRFCKF